MKLLPSREFLSTRKGPLLALCLPVICSCLMGWSGSRPQPMANVPELPGLSFDQYLVDLREVVPTEEIFGYFGFRNTSPHTVTITSMEPSCGCLTPQLHKEKKVYEPGETGSFKLRIKTALQKPGFKEFTVKVHYTDSQPRTREVFLRAIFPDKQIYVRPMSLTFHQLGTLPVDQEIIVTDLRPAPADVIGATCTSDFVQLQILEPTTSKTGARQQRIRVTVTGAVPTGRHVASIQVFTNDERFHDLKVPIQIFGPPKTERRHAVANRTIGPQAIGPIRR